jgi:hypothetical protein
MKHVWNQVRRASAKISTSVSASVAATVAAGAVMVIAAPASAENRPGLFETEFEFDGISAGAAATAQVKAAGFDVSSAAAKWEESIGEYLDGLVDEITPVVEERQAPADDFVANEVEAFAVADGAKPEVKPLPPEVLEALGIDPAEVAEAEVQDVLIDVPAKGDDGAEAKPQAAAQAAAAHEEPAINPLLLAPVLSHPMDCELCRAMGKWTEVGEAEWEAEAGEGLVDDMAAWQKLAEWASARVSGEEATQVGDDVAAVDDEDDSSLAD